MIKFKCEKCGTCCRSVKCEHLTDDNLCKIYDTRPTICRVDRVYRIKKRHDKSLTWRKYIRMSHEACAKLREAEAC